MGRALVARPGRRRHHLHGLPAALVLVAVASLGAILGIAAGTFDVATLGALPTRLINLFENDLLQALPLYVTMGLLLDRLPVADALYRTAMRCCRENRRRRWCRACCSARCSGR